MRTKLDRNSTSGNRQSWYKKVTKVDITKINGYAFEGDFLPIEREIDLNEGDVVIESRPRGSVKNSVNEAYVYRVENGKLIMKNEITGEGDWGKSCYYDWYQTFLSFRDFVASLFSTKKENKLAGISMDELQAEIKRRER